ncbi:Uncharacterised protein [Achromobacter xylosoxidans]|uniref:hypothetical protein n=1 Tax=Alcaligenes xylosoxydans xylosoxydans TaxID=85698 RepID=UPI0006C29870|nr:hypothetical protein [Achromobacter xylosoxidans]CUJ52980.1 Uncharacterised protein [Achromobacter xylosoxidans]
MTQQDDITQRLNEIHADAGYLFGRVAADGACAGAMAESVRARIDAIKALLSQVRAPVADERQAVAYLDLGAGGYMDVGTDLTDKQLAALPKGRHMLAIIGTHGVDGYTPASAPVAGKTRESVDYVRGGALNFDAHPDGAPVAGEAVYTLRVRGAIQAWTPTAAAFSIPDGEHQLFLSPAAPQASECECSRKSKAVSDSEAQL